MKNILLITHLYPKKGEESFIKTEAHHLKECFDTVYYYPLKVNKIYSFDGNKEVRDTKISSIDIIEHSIKIIPIIIIEVLRVLFVYKKFLNKLVFRKLMYSLRIGLNNTIMIRKWMFKNNIKSEELVIYSYWFTELAFIAAYLRYNYNKLKAISRAHRYDLYLELNEDRYLPFRHFSLSKLTRLMVISKDGYKSLKNEFSYKLIRKISVDRMGVEKGRRSTSEKDQLNVISISYISQVKRIDRIIEVLSLIDNKSINWVHFGNGEDRYKIIQMAEDILNNKPNITFEFAGHVEHDRLLEYLDNEAIDILINLSDSEGIPVTMMEAISRGITIFATDVGGVKELVTDKFGMIVSPDESIEGMKAKFEEFIEKYENNRNQFSINAIKQWDKKYNISKNVKKIIRRMEL